MKFCKVADIQDWQNEEFPKIESILHSTSRGRKAWEFIHVYYGLQELGLLNGQSRALGLGVGHEPLVFALSNVCGAVVATDLYESQNWSTAAMKTNEVYDKSPFPFERDRLTVQHMDMTQIDFPDNSFDFIWSCCAIEHVNSFKDLHKVYEEIHRVLKPGGIAALTTEYNPTDLHSYEPNMLFTDRYWIDRWFTGDNPLVQGFELLDPIDYSIAPLPENEPLPRNTSRHVVQAYVKDIVLSSIAFFIRKAGDFSRPYDDQWLAPDWRDYLAACDANRAKQFAQAEALLKPLVDDDTVAVRLRVAAMRRLADALDGQGKTSEIPGLAKTFMQYYDQASCSDHLMSITNSFKRAGLWDDTQRIYERVEQLPGTHIDQVIRSIIAQAYHVSRQGDSEKALTILARAWQRHTNSTGTKEVPRIYWHEGMYHENLGRLDQAIAAYQQAIEAATPGSNLYDVATQHLNACLKKRDEQAHDTMGLNLGLKSRLRQVKSALSGLKQRLLN